MEIQTRRHSREREIDRKEIVMRLTNGMNVLCVNTHTYKHLKTNKQTNKHVICSTNILLINRPQQHQRQQLNIIYLITDFIYKWKRLTNFVYYSKPQIKPIKH